MARTGPWRWLVPRGPRAALSSAREAAGRILDGPLPKRPSPGSRLAGMAIVGTALAGGALVRAGSAMRPVCQPGPRPRPCFRPPFGYPARVGAGHDLVREPIPGWPPLLLLAEDASTCTRCRLAGGRTTCRVRHGQPGRASSCSSAKGQANRKTSRAALRRPFRPAARPAGPGGDEPDQGRLLHHEHRQVPAAR